MSGTEHVDLLSEPLDPFTPLTADEEAALRPQFEAIAKDEPGADERIICALFATLDAERAARSATPSSKEAEEEDGVDPDDYYAGPFNTAGGHEHWGDR